MRKIPVGNIYYLLSYVWNYWDEGSRIKVDAQESNSLVDLLARVLINETTRLLKRGIKKQYLETEEVLNGIKGKILFDASLKRNLLKHQRAICRYDELSENILLNRIIYSTILNLIRTDSLEESLRHSLSKLTFRLKGIRPIKIQRSHFFNLTIGRNEKSYTLLIHVCKVIFEQLIFNEESGTFVFKEFTEKQIHTLFEKYLKAFYKKEQIVYETVESRIFKWKLISKDDPQSQKYLPQMKTDVTLESEERRIIIEAKYYKETMAKNYQQEKIITGNLYQLFSYLINQENDQSDKTHKTTGILLYPQVTETYDLQYTYEQHEIRIKTIDLWMSPEEIKRDLLSLIGL